MNPSPIGFRCHDSDHTSSNIIDNLSIECEKSSSKALLFFYFDFDNPTNQTSKSLLRSLLGQLCLQSKNLPKALRSCFEISGNGAYKPASSSILRCLELLAEDFGKIYIVVDALDECIERATLLDTLEKVSQFKQANIFMLLTSRRERDIESQLRGLDLHDISFQETQTNEDIVKYLDAVLQQDKKLSRWTSEIRQEIETSLMNRAHGM